MLLFPSAKPRHPPPNGICSDLSTEPNSYEKKAGIRVDGYQLGLDFSHLRKILSESELYRDAALYGPDVGQPHSHRVDLLKRFGFSMKLLFKLIHDASLYLLKMVDVVERVEKGRPFCSSPATPS